MILLQAKMAAEVLTSILCYFSSGVSDPKNLMPMYKKLHSAIREYDDEHIILFEPTIIITSVRMTTS